MKFGDTKKKKGKNETLLSKDCDLLTHCVNLKISMKTIFKNCSIEVLPNIPINISTFLANRKLSELEIV